MKITNISRYIAWILVVCMITVMIPKEALARGVDPENPTLNRVVESEKTPIIMENDNYEISMAPIGKNNESINNDNDIVVAEKEKVPGVYTKEEDKKIKAIYGKNRELTYEYISGTDGVKENLILKKAPENNIFEIQV